ncbi:MAG: 2-hydroxyacid dehydrogenase [Marinagarivorans sp.]|nr:2-hydroxyacid dehydrogenase [Marinagarivorans sp.]
MHIAFFSSKPYDHLFFDAPSNTHDFIYIDAHLTENTVALAQGCDAVCCFVNDTLNKEVLKALVSMNIQLIVLRCAGFNNVDLAAAKQLNITVARVPEYSPFAVAEHAVGLILTLNRNIHRAYNRIRENDYSLNGLMGFDLHGKTVGVIGAGKIGQAFIKIMQGFGCHILIRDDLAPDLPGTQKISLDELWPACDIVSLHCPLLPQTHHIINAQSLSQMPKGAMLINTSRGALVDTSAAINALKSGHLGYLGIDVYEEEADLFFENLSNTIIQDDIFARLTTFPNVIVTGHQAFFTREALQKIAEVTLNNITAYSLKNFAGIKTVNI